MNRVGAQRFAAISVDLDTAARDLTEGSIGVSGLAMSSATYTRLLPRFLDLLKEHEIRATLFVVGEDLNNPIARYAIRKASGDGHEIANHTMHHNKQFVHLGADLIWKEIDECDKVLSDLTGQPVRGFRAPGYTVTREVIDALRALGYVYDSSLNPSLIFNGAKYLFKKFLTKNRGLLTSQNVLPFFIPRQPYFPREDDLYKPQRTGDFVEIPITSVPYIDYPYISGLLFGLPLTVAIALYQLIRLQGRVFNFELHDIELATPEDFPVPVDGLYFTSRYVRKPLGHRRRFFREIFARAVRDFRVMTLGDAATEFLHASVHRHG